MILEKDKNQVYFSSLFARHYSPLFNEIGGILAANHVGVGTLKFTKDYWCRDYMPVQCGEGNFVQFSYTPDYLKDQTRYRTDANKVIFKMTLDIKPLQSQLVVDGGNFVFCRGMSADGSQRDYCVMTDKVVDENPGLSLSDIEASLRTHLGENMVFVWLPWRHSDTCGHADGILRYVGIAESGKPIVLTNLTLYGKSLAREMRQILEEHFEVVELSLSHYGELSWAYINSLQTNEVIIVPGIGDKQTDHEALEQIKLLYPQYKGRVYQVQMREVIQEWGGALNCCSWTILQGDKAPRDRKLTAVHYMKLAQHGDAWGLFKLGVCYKYGYGVQKNYAKAAQYFSLASDKGYAKAQFELGECYFNGHGVKRDFRKAVYWFSQSANNGFSGGETNLGFCYSNGYGVEANYAKALSLFRSAIAKGSDFDYFNLANCYEYGLGVIKDEARALELYRTASEKGIPVTEKISRLSSKKLNMNLYEQLLNFKGADNEDDLWREFRDLAHTFLYGGYINVNGQYKVFIRTVEFYFHSEMPGGIKDPIVYHRNCRNLVTVPYFPTMTLHAHASGYDITFENEERHYRASALIRAYEVLDNNNNYLRWLPNEDGRGMFIKSINPCYDTQSTSLYYILNGFGLMNNNAIEWKDVSWVKTLEIISKPRINVHKYNGNQKLKEKDYRKWSFTRQENLPEEIVKQA